MILSERTADDDPADVPTSTSPAPSTSTTSTTTTSTTTTTISPVDEQLASMTREQKAGQVLVAQFSGQPDPDVLESFRAGRAGTAFVTARSGNLTDIDGTTAMIASLQTAAAANGTGLLVATDQEGGRVQQVDIDGITPFPPADRYGGIAASSGLDEAESLTRAAHQVMATELHGLGINVDFAPVADVNVVGDQGAIRNRSFSAEPASATALTVAAVEGLEVGGVAGTVKHFPGHGSTAVDSHEQLPVVERSRDEWWVADAAPFVAAIEADVALVMVGHLHYPALDPEIRPASLSPVVVTDLLRGELGFTGVVVSDDLGAMAPVAGLPVDELVVDALNAGVDLLLTPSDIDTAHAAIVAAVADGRISPQTLDAAVGRVLALKQRMGVLDPDGAPPPPPPDVDGALVRLVLSNACTAAGITC